MIEPMVKVRLVSPRRVLDPVTSMLQSIGVLHIESMPTEAMRVPLRPQVMDEPARRRGVELRCLREELRRLLVLLPESPLVAPSGAEPARHVELTEEERRRVTDLVREIGREVDALSGKLKACEEELALLAKYERVLTALGPFVRFLHEGEGLDYLGVTIEEAKGDRLLLPLLHELMAKITERRYELFQARVDERTQAILLVFPKSCGIKVRSLLWEEGVTELRLPAAVSDKSLGQALRIILQKQADLPSEISSSRRGLRDIAFRWRQDIERYHDAVSRGVEQIEATSLFYQTEMTIFVYGWVPRRRLNALQCRIRNEFGERVVLEECPILPGERHTVPVVLRNPCLLRPFETLTRLIALPQYGSIDPTPYLAVFIPLFYGMILGDVGYGLLLLAGATVVRRRYVEIPIVRDLAAVFLVASAMSVMFGVLFGELFGELGEHIGLRPILNRMEAFIPFLALSIAIGTLHVALGIVLGAWSAWHRGDRRECSAKLGGLLLVVSFVALIASVANLLPRTWVTAETAALLLSLVTVFVFGGARGAMELHNLVNVLSYLRLMGIGVASAALAFAANTLGGMVGNVFLAVAIAGTLHAINLVFGVLSPTIQSLRLHYVEFFENFFAPGGRPYRPFKRQEG